MNWDQIEIKWAEMTRRVRADLPMPAPDDGMGPVRAKANGHVRPAASGHVPENESETAIPVTAE